MERFGGMSRAQASFAFLRRHIVTGAWPVGSAIPKEPELCELLGVGRSTVREAVRSLAALGVLETVPGRGTFVRSRSPLAAVTAQLIDVHPIQDVLTYRRSLEVEAARRAAVHRSEDDLAALRAAHLADVARGTSGPHIRRLPGAFHQGMFAAAGSVLLAELYAGLLDGLHPARTGPTRLDVQENAARHAEHAELLEAITAGDADQAVEAMTAHVAHDLRVPPPNG